MNDSSLSLDHRLSELRQVAEELRVTRTADRNERTGVLATARLALGRAFLAAATSLLADTGKPNLAAR
jgi:hypothetical protein